MAVGLDDVRRSITALVRQNKIYSLIYSLVVPTLVGVYATFYGDLIKVSPLLFWAPVTGFVIFALLAAYFTYDIVLAPEVYVEMEASRLQIDRLERTTKFLSVLQEQALILGYIVREQIKKKTDGNNALKEAVNEICYLLVRNRDALFSFESNELWSFALYVYSTKDGYLHSVWRSKHPRHPSQSIGRKWEPGQGHVGIAWAQAEGKICPDITAYGIAEMFSPKDAKQPYDLSTYTSFVSEPLGPLGDNRHPYGVLVATSSLAGRFNIGSALPLRHAASAIAALVYLAYDQAALETLVETAKPAE